MSYTPPAHILTKYAKVLINFALNDGWWVKHGDTVLLQIPESAKSFAIYLQEEVLLAWAHPIVRILPEWLGKHFIEFAQDHQLTRRPQDLMLAEIAQVDHRVRIISQYDKYEMDGVNSTKLMQRMSTSKFYADAMTNKENQWKMSWTACLYATPAMAQEVGLSIESYRDQIVHACFLDYEDPIEWWKEVFAYIGQTKSKLNTLSIDHLHMVWDDADLIIKLWPNRKWLWCSGRNIPSFEIFISPDRRWTQWRIRCNQPLYRYGTLIDNIRLEFVNGLVVNATADKWQQALQDMIAVCNADKIGEYSLTDRRSSRITHFMAETLYDENVWWEYGNTHIALGNAYKDSFPGDPSIIATDQREAMGYNESVIHTDVVSTSDRTVTATLMDGSQMIIYSKGEFTI
jgi:aminopeptidase